MKSEVVLIRRCQDGDSAAFEQLIHRFERRVFGLIYQIIRSPNEVDDIAQEIFIKLYLSLPQFRLDASFDAWLYRIVVNQCYDFLRKRKRTPQLSEADLSEDEARYIESLASVTQPQAAEMDRELEVRDAAQNLLRALPPKDRMLLILKEVDELTIEELSAIFKTTKSAIKLRLFRARNRLKSVYLRKRRAIRK
ncbi:MAG: sigma-70 family RNA polymerase sigma factor [Acidobacteriota bacterium]